MIQIEKTKMVDAMRAVMPGVDKGDNGIDGANLFLFKDNRLFTYNGVTSVSVPFPMDNAKFGVNATNIFSFVNKLNDLSVNIDFIHDKDDPSKVSPSRSSLARPRPPSPWQTPLKLRSTSRAFHSLMASRARPTSMTRSTSRRSRTTSTPR
jgi:hypothetical protein